MAKALDPIRESPDEQVAELVRDFLDAQLSPRTRSSYAGDLAAYLRWLKTIDVGPLQARRPHIDRFRNYLTELVDADGKPSASGQPRYQPSTVARRLAAVRSFYKYLTDQRVLGASPAVGVKSPKVTREPKGKGLAEDHLRRLLEAAAAEGPNEEAIVYVLGLRAGLLNVERGNSCTCHKWFGAGC